MTLSTDYSKNLSLIEEKLRFGKNFDVLKRSLTVGRGEISFFFIDGFVKDGELQRIMQSLEADELSDIQPSDLEGIDVAPDPGIYDSFNFLLRELEADGNVKCPCDNGEYDLRFTDDGIQVYCKSCGATHTFYALSAAMAEEYLGTDEIILK